MELNFYKNHLNDSLKEFISFKKMVLLNNLTEINSDYSFLANDRIGGIFLRHLLEDSKFANQYEIYQFFVDSRVFAGIKCQDDFASKLLTYQVHFYYVKKCDIVLFYSSKVHSRAFIFLLTEAIKNNKLFESLIVTEDNTNPDYIEDEDEELSIIRVKEKEDEIKANILSKNTRFVYIETCNFADFETSTPSNELIKTTTILKLIELIDADFKILSSEVFKKEIKEVINNAQRISEQGIAYFIQNDKKKFGQSLLNSVFSKIFLKYNEKQRIIVYDYILFSYDNPTVLLKELATFNYAYKSFEYNKQVGGLDFLDLTMVLVTIFKCVEILFCKFVNDEFGHLSFIPNSGRRERIYLGDNDLTLGTLYKLFDTDEPEIVRFLNQQNKYSRQLENVLYEFINYSRNGYLHKDVIDNESEFHLSLEDSLDAIFLLILMFEDR